MTAATSKGEIMQAVTITRYKQYARPGQFGPEWKWIYELPPITRQLGDRIVTDRPGGFSSKAETLALVRRLYDARPLTVEWPDGKTTEIKR